MCHRENCEKLRIRNEDSERISVFIFGASEPEETLAHVYH